MLVDYLGNQVLTIHVSQETKRRGLDGLTQGDQGWGCVAS
jgi:hypothetical protein